MFIEWLLKGKITKLVVAIVSKSNSETVELWHFDVNVIASPPISSPSVSSTPEKSPSQLQTQKEIQSIIRQITASTTFLPVLEPDQYTFNVQVYADTSAQVPTEWADSVPRKIDNGEQVQLRSFSTDNYEVSTMVAYKLGVENNA